MRSYLPVVQLTANGSLDFSNGYSHVPIDQSPGTALTENKTWTGSAGIGFTWSIFDGGISAANAQSSYAQSRQNIADAEDQRLSVVNQVESSFASMKTSKVSISSAHSAYSSANHGIPQLVHVWLLVLAISRVSFNRCNYFPLQPNR